MNDRGMYIWCVLSILSLMILLVSKKSRKFNLSLTSSDGTLQSVKGMGLAFTSQVNYVLKRQSDGELYFEFPWKFYALFFTLIGSMFTSFLALNCVQSKHTPVFVIILAGVPILICFLTAIRYIVLRISVVFDQRSRSVIISMNGRQQQYGFGNIQKIEVIIPSDGEPGVAINRFLCITFIDGNEILLGYNMFGAFDTKKILVLEEQVRRFIE